MNGSKPSIAPLKWPVPSKKEGTQARSWEQSRSLKTLIQKEIVFYVPTFPVSPSFLKRRGKRNTKIQVIRHLMCRMGAGFPEHLRQQKYPANTLAGAANTSPGPAYRMGCAVAGPTCPPPSGLSTPSASCPLITGPTATPGHCTHPGDRLPCGEGGVNLWLTWLQDRTVPEIFTYASFGVFFCGCQWWGWVKSRALTPVMTERLAPHLWREIANPGGG